MLLFFNPDFGRKQDIYHYCLALNLGASSVNWREHQGYEMLIQLIPTSLEQAGRELGQGGACGTGHAQGRLKIHARGWWESLFLPLTEQIITVDTHALEETKERA